MASKLYQNAVAALGPNAAARQAAREKIARAPVEDSANQSGQAVARMVQTEHQLSDDPRTAEPELMKLLLACLSSMRWPAEAQAFARAYGLASGLFRLRGRPIQSSPDVLFRYCNGPGLIRKICDELEAADSEFAEVLRQFVERASNGTGSWADAIDFLRTPEVWQELPREAINVSGTPSVFVTFDAGQTTDRNNAEGMHRALALWKPKSECFIELRYPADQVEELRFPTLADAGWFRYFHSVEPGTPHGLTKPHDQNLAKQPEAVHEPRTLSVLTTPRDVRLIGP